MSLAINLAKSITRKLRIEDQSRRIWRNILNVIRSAQTTHNQINRNRKYYDAENIRLSGREIFKYENRASFLSYASQLPPDDEDRLKISQHMFQLKNYSAALKIVETLDPKRQVPKDIFFLGRIKLSSCQGVESDQLLEWFFNHQRASKLSEKDQIGLADWISISGTTSSIKLSRLAGIRHEIDKLSSMSEVVRRHIRFLEFKISLASDGWTDIFAFGDFDQPDLDSPDYQLRFIPNLNILGYGDKARHLLTGLLRHYGPKHKGIVSAALRLDPVWPGIDISQLSEDYSSELGTLQIAYLYRNISDEYYELFKASVNSHMLSYNDSDIRTKDKILRNLLRCDLIDEIEALVSTDSLPDTVLSLHSANGLRFFMEDDFVSARDCFMRVLEEDPSDPFASEGMRLALPRSGGDMYSVIRLRKKIGYGIKSNGRVGGRNGVDPDKTISLLMSGRYIEGLYSKRHAEQWQYLKKLYGKRFLNYEMLPYDRGKEKSLFVIADDGVGDEVRTAQFYATLADRFGRVVISCDPRFEEIFKRSFPSIIFVPSRRYRKGLIEKMDLIGRMSGMNHKLSNFLNEECKIFMDKADIITFGQMLFFNYFNGNIQRPENGAYLHSLAKVIRSDNGVSHKIKVGIIWRSHLQSMRRKFMYLKVEDFIPLLEAGDNIEFYSVQHSINNDEYKFCKDYNIHLIEDVDLFNDFDGLASYLKGMDLVIGISSLPMELAAAVGTPVWMLGFSPENYYLRTAAGKTEVDQLTLNSKVIAPRWIDFTEPTKTCINLVMHEAHDRLIDLCRHQQADTS